MRRYNRRTDRLKGGMADNAPYCKFDKKEMELGEEIEAEHTDNIEIRREISGDHLMENPHYNSDLKEMEEKHERELKRRNEVYVPPYFRRDGTPVKGYIRKKG